MLAELTGGIIVGEAIPATLPPPEIKKEEPDLGRAPLLSRDCLTRVPTLPYSVTPLADGDGDGLRRDVAGGVAALDRDGVDAARLTVALGAKFERQAARDLPVAGDVLAAGDADDARRGRRVNGVGHARRDVHGHHLAVVLRDDRGRGRQALDDRSRRVA